MELFCNHFKSDIRPKIGSEGEFLILCINYGFELMYVMENRFSIMDKNSDQYKIISHRFIYLELNYWPNIRKSYHFRFQIRFPKGIFWQWMDKKTKAVDSEVISKRMLIFLSIFAVKRFKRSIKMKIAYTLISIYLELFS